jgi:hypothetical protein
MTIGLAIVIAVRLLLGGNLVAQPFKYGLAICSSLFTAMSLALFMGESDVTNIDFPGANSFTVTVLAGSAICAGLLAVWPEFSSFVISIGIVAAATILALAIASPCRPFGATMGVLLVLGVCLGIATGTFNTARRRGLFRR